MHSMLTSLTAKNFKSWQSIDAMRLAPITGLFGPNSSGKTSLIQLLLLLKQTAESTDKGQVLNFGGDDRSLVSLGTFRDVIFGHDVSAPLHISLSWHEPSPVEIVDPTKGPTELLFSGSDLSFSTEIAGSEEGRLTVERFAYGLDSNVFSMTRARRQEYTLAAEAGAFRFVRTQGRKWPLPPPVKFYGFPDQVRAYYQNAGFVAELELAFERLFGSIYYLGPLREYPEREYTWGGGMPADVGRRGDRVVDALLASRARGRQNSRGYRKRRMTLEEHVAVWLRELGLIHSFEVEQIAPEATLYRVLVRKTRTSPQVLITDVGFGVSQILPVLVLCFYVPKGSIVVLEQPEIHLHPAVQAGLADVLIEAAQARRIQIIVESHSEYLLQRLQRRIAEEALEPSSVALYFSDVSAGRSVLTPLEVDLFGNIANWPKDFFGNSFGEMAAMAEAALRRRGAGT
jgi:hypothetical protein